uniref:Geranylgeranylglyceryl phosphate synthase n=1 Tax=Fervidicoccus fontis TaxID=683846 RepID=A0A7J3SKI2_9CREN
MKVSEYLKQKRDEGPLHLALIDPQKTDAGEAERIGRELMDLGTDAFLVGGSLGVDQREAEEVVKKLKSSGAPVIIFPGDVNNVVRGADAILFMSLLNSDSVYHLIGAQVQGAILVKKYHLEPLPTGYIIIGYGGAAGYVGRARPIPLDQPYIAVAYAMAAEMLGMKYIYLEAGSGSPQSVPPEIVRAVKKNLEEAFLIVGGGIRTPDAAKLIVEAGADMIVTGNILEKDLGAAKDIIRAIKRK